MTTRNIGEVIDRIKAAIPEGAKIKLVGLKELRRNLDHIKENAGYTAPELQGNNWHSLCTLLNNTVAFPPETPWQQEVHDIITAKK